MSKEVQKWSDEYMFSAEKVDASAGPQVFLLGAPSDPLGQIAASAKMYKGEVVRDLADVTDDERRYYLEQMQLTKLKMPLEGVSLHFMLEGVTRGFTHQLVRQRTAAYAQESTRFAVKEDLATAVALPPSLAGTKSWPEFLEDHQPTSWTYGDFKTWAERNEPAQAMRFKWDEIVNNVAVTYNQLVNMGMPAEDARGLMPTNILTRTNYITNLRGLLDHAGNRLCTQAQFEWRLVFAQIANAMRKFGLSKMYNATDELTGEKYTTTSDWQWVAIAALLQPVCYQTGSCAFQAEFDRKCSIRNRVQANAELNRPSQEWGTELDNIPEDAPGFAAGFGPTSVVRDDRPGGRNEPVFIGAIQPREWLADPAAAR